MVNTLNPGTISTVTVTFNEAMASGPRITIGTAVSNLASLQPVVIHLLTLGALRVQKEIVTVTGTDLAGNVFKGN